MERNRRIQLDSKMQIRSLFRLTLAAVTAGSFLISSCSSFISPVSPSLHSTHSLSHSDSRIPESLFPSKNVCTTIRPSLIQFGRIKKSNFLQLQLQRKYHLSYQRLAKESVLFGKYDDDDDDDDEEIDLSGRDWRAFRAQLVMSSPELKKQKGQQEPLEIEEDFDGIGSLFSDNGNAATTDTSPQQKTQQPTIDEASNKPLSLTPLEPSQWAYDSGKVIEQGAVILGGVEQDFGFGLRQQYFHKAVILVLDHDEGKFTKGVLLNRPSDILIEDDVNPGVKWRVWFGGDVQGLESKIPDIICLHSIKGNDDVDKVSTQVMRDVKWTTFQDAKKVVKSGNASPTDFWVFAGYAGWGPSQLMGELERKSWYMCATDSQTLLKELAKQSEYADPRDAGLDTWELLMKMIGRGETAEESSEDFDDLMLKEWARDKLLSVEAGGGAGTRMQPADVASTKELLRADPIDLLIKRAAAASRGEDITAGSLVRASSSERSPFLLSRQEFHKSIVLIISDDENVSVGVMLNHPAAKGIELELVDKKTLKKYEKTIALRYGGEYAVRGQSGMLWLHNSEKLRRLQVGSPVSQSSRDGIWKCSQQEATNAISKGMAVPSHFMVVSGVSVWTKGEKGIARGMQGEVRSGRFEVVPSSRIDEVWHNLKRQEVLTKINLLKNLEKANMAWEAGRPGKRSNDDPDKDIPVTDGIGEGFDEDDDSFVFKSDVKVSKLSDDALRSWVATFLLGAPTLGA